MTEVSAAVLAAAAFPAHTAPLAGGVALPPGTVPFANASGALAGDGAFTRDLTTGLVSIHAGDLLGTFTPQVVDIRHGTTGAPVATPGPTFKVSRVESISQATIYTAPGFVGTDGSNQVAAIAGYSKALSTSDVQPVGVLASASSASTSVVVGTGHDACGLYAVGTHSGTGIGIGAFITSSRGSDSAKSNALQMNVDNQGSDSNYNATGLSTVTGVWSTASGLGDAGVGYVFGNPFGRQFAVGIGFTGQVAGGKTGAIKTTSISDDGAAVTSYAVNGSHTYGIDTKGGTFSGAPIRLGNAQNIAARNAADSADIALIGLTSGNLVSLGPLGSTLVGTSTGVRTATIEVLSVSGRSGIDVQGSGGNIAVFRNNAGASQFFMTETAFNVMSGVGLFKFGVSGENASIQFIEEQITLSTGGATTDSAANLLPANAEILAVTARVTTAITGATDWQVGDATTASRFLSTGNALTAGTTKVGLNHKNGAAAGAASAQLAAAKVRITATGTPTAGVIRVAVAYILHAAPTV